MTFSNARQVAVLTFAWAAGLLALDYVKNRHLWQPATRGPQAVAGTHVTLWINHLCCTGCMADVQAALAGLPWAGGIAMVRGGAVLSREQADALGRPLAEYGNWVDLEVRDVSKLEFVALDRALREKGMVPGRIEFGGLEHFRLEAEVAHLCCGMCERGAESGLEFAKAHSFTGRLTWLDSVSVDRTHKRILAHARFLGPGKTIDVSEFLAGLDYVGLAPSSVRVLSEVARPLKVASGVPSAGAALE
jgi:hypothetical protein